MLSSHNLLTRSRTMWPDIWSARDCWCEMPSTAIWRWIARMKTRWINCEGIPLLATLRWVLNIGPDCFIISCACELKIPVYRISLPSETHAVSRLQREWSIRPIRNKTKVGQQTIPNAGREMAFKRVFVCGSARYKGQQQ